LGKVEQNMTINISGNPVFNTNSENRDAYQILSLEDINVTSPAAGFGTYVGNVVKSRISPRKISVLYFDYDLLPKEDNKKDIINQLSKLHKTNKRVKLDGLRTKFYLLDNLLNRLGSDPYVSNDDKIYVYKLLVDSIKRQNKLLNNKK